MMSRQMSKSLGNEVAEERIYCTLEELVEDEVCQTSSPASNQPFGIENDASAEMKFDGLLVDAIDETLASLGKTVANAFYSHLENDFEIKKEQIPEKIKEFSYILHKVFGLGANRLETKFLQNLRSKIGENALDSSIFPSNLASLEMTFVDCIYAVRRDFKRYRC